MYLRSVINTFYGNRSLVLLLVPILTGVFALMNVFFPLELPSPVPNDAWWALWIDESSWWSQLIAFFLVGGNAILLNFIFNANNFKERNTYIPSLLYVLVHSFFHSFYYLSGFSFLTTFFLLILYQIFKLDQNQDGRKRVFNIGFFLGMGITLYPPAFVFILPVQVGIWVLRPFVFRESLLFFAGIAVPFAYTTLFFLYYDLSFSKLLFEFSPQKSNRLAFLILASIILLFSLVSVPKYFQRNSSSSIRQKKLNRILIIFMFSFLGLSVVEYLFFSMLESIQLIFIPLVFILSNLFGDRKPDIFPTFITYLLLCIALVKGLLVQLAQ